MSGGAPEAPPAEREWHWVGLSAVLAIAVSTLAVHLVLPALFGAHREGLRDMPVEQAEAVVTELVVVSALLFALSAFAAGVVTGRFKKAPGLGEAPLGMLVASVVLAWLGRQAVAVLYLAPLLGLSALAGGALGRRLRRRALSPRIQPPPA